MRHLGCACARAHEPCCLGVHDTYLSHADGEAAPAQLSLGSLQAAQQGKVIRREVTKRIPRAWMRVPQRAIAGQAVPCAVLAILFGAPLRAAASLEVVVLHVVSLERMPDQKYVLSSLTYLPCSTEGYVCLSCECH